MSYQVLARKWRPRIFREMVGQTHVLQALINALDHDRLHHAYLFTGTRGVGKTSIARILSKCLNCEAGVSSEPCGQCGACREIEEGRFVDLIEVDAASRTKVEDTRELLDNVQYAPTRGRFKVYLIDEVHMLSTHSFNALLKTLEEPPPHVKFLLATTDPQKLPVTILSRCLQFNLKNMSPERIVEHLAHVLEQEMIPFEQPALWQLGRAADGSMRDALSLTDQAIAYGAGRVNELEVSAMLGTIDQSQVYAVIDAVLSGDASSSLAAVEQLAEFSPDYGKVLADMLSVMHRMSVAQAVPDAVDNSQGDCDKVVAMAAQITAEDLHLYYQIALIGRKDLTLAPDPRAGFEMVLLRMLAFTTEGTLEPPTEKLSVASGSTGGLDPAGKVDGMVDGVVASDSTTVISGEKPEINVSANGRSSNQHSSTANASIECSPVENVGAKTSDVEGIAVAECAAPAEPQGNKQDSVGVDSVPEMVEELVPEKTAPASVVNSSQSLQSPGGVEAKKPLATAETSLTPAAHPVPPAPVVESEDIPELMDAYAAEASYQHYAELESADTDSLQEQVPVTSDTAQAPALDSVSPVVTLAVEEKFDVGQVCNTQEGDEPLVRIPLDGFSAGDWVREFKVFGLAGVTLSIAAHFEFCTANTEQVVLRIAPENSTLLNATHQGRVEKALQEYFQHPVKLIVEQQATVEETPVQYQARRAEERLVHARRVIADDQNVKALVTQFSATIVEDSIQPKH